MRSSKKQTGLLTATIGLLALAISAGVQAKTLVYCSEGSPEGFNPNYLPQVRLMTQVQYRFMIA